jgi:aminoglycoside phosphotransferase (APT) family kinase protein
MSEGQRRDERPSEELARVVLDRFGVSLADADGGWQGEESVGWRGSSDDGDRFVQRFPAWRAVEDLSWCDSVAAVASTAAPACVHAIASKEGHVAVRTAEGPVMVFPSIEGPHPAGGEIREQAAEVLASMHRGIVSTWSGSGRPRSAARYSSKDPADPLVDPELDRWERSVDGRGAAFPIHGDFYGGNLLVAADHVAGVIDWSDAHLSPFEREVGWATWEFCQNDAGDDLIDEHAEAFLRIYEERGGPADVGAPFDPMPWIRRRLRAEARSWFADARSQTERSQYHEAQLVAFERLRFRRLPAR